MALQELFPLFHRTIGNVPDDWDKPPATTTSSLDWLFSFLKTAEGTAKRGARAAAYIVITLVSLLIFMPIMIILGIGAIAGNSIMAWMMLFVMVFSLLGIVWTVRKVNKELSAPSTDSASSVETIDAESNNPESQLKQLLRSNARLPDVMWPAFRSTVIATRNALRATSKEGFLSRENFDARQAAERELPELIENYKALPPSSRTDIEFLEQLRLIEQRMQKVAVLQQEDAERTLKSQRRYLEDKYEPEKEKIRSK